MCFSLLSVDPSFHIVSFLFNLKHLAFFSFLIRFCWLHILSSFIYLKNSLFHLHFFKKISIYKIQSRDICFFSDFHVVWSPLSWVLLLFWGFPVAQTVKNSPAMQETQVTSLGQEDPLEEGKATHSRILAWSFSGTEEPGGLQSLWVTKSRTRLSNWTTLKGGRFAKLGQDIDMKVGKPVQAREEDITNCCKRKKQVQYSAFSPSQQ